MMHMHVRCKAHRLENSLQALHWLKIILQLWPSSDLTPSLTQPHLAVRVQQAKVGVQLAAVVTRQLRANAVQGDVEGAAVGLWGWEGQGGEFTQLSPQEQLAHDLPVDVFQRPSLQGPVRQS